MTTAETLDDLWEAMAADVHAHGYSVRDALAEHRPAIEAEATRLALEDVAERVRPLVEAAQDVRKHHAPNEWDICVACSKTWPCDAELLAELVLTLDAVLALLSTKEEGS